MQRICNETILFPALYRPKLLYSIDITVPAAPKEQVPANWTLLRRIPTPATDAYSCNKIRSRRGRAAHSCEACLLLNCYKLATIEGAA